MRTRSSVVILAVVSVLAGCGSSGGTTSSTSLGTEFSGTTFTVGSKDFSESEILGQITMKLLAAHGATVVDKTNIKGSVTTRQAMLSGDIDMYWEYTGTAWVSYLQHTTPIADPAKQFEAVKTEDLAKNKVTWLPAAPLNNTYALAVLKTTADKLNVKTLSQYAQLAASDPAKAAVCLESEFSTRDDGWPGLQKAYGITLPANGVKMLDTGVIYNETSKGTTCSFGEVFATDGRIQSLSLTTLADDKHFFPEYNAALTLPQQLADKHPAIATIMTPVTARLTTETMRKLNAKVDVDGLTPAEVADDWLKSEKLLG
jgi:osmoprotectant transport system substrate-binding protein